MSELKQISPMLDDFDVGGAVSEHAGVCCYPAMRKGTDERFIIKTVSIPASQTQLDALLLTGAFPDATSALTYFQELSDRTVQELELLQQLSQAEGFLCYDSWQVSAKDDGIGFDVYMISPYKLTLRKLMSKQPMTHLGAINLGLDICTALAVSRRMGYLYVDLKPNNIYVVDGNRFRIGDLGFISMDSLAYASLPDKYQSEYTAPELLDPFATLSATLDVYALGLILYQIYNGGQLPTNAEDGSFPPPENADYEMAEIILKACAQDPAERWQDPVEMGQALVGYMQRNGANDVPILPPVVITDEIPAILDEQLDFSDIDLENIPEDIDEDLDEQLEIDGINLEAVLAELPDQVDLPADAEIEVRDTAEASVEDAHDDISEPPAAELEDPEEDEPIDETAPENNMEDVAYTEVSDDLAEILAQADDLVAHPIPEPAVAPEPIDIVIPELEDVAQEELPAELEDIADPENQDLAETMVVSGNFSELSQDEDAQEPAASAEVEACEEEPIKPVKKKKSALQLVLNIVLIVLLLAVIVMGLFYYKNVYLLPIDSLTISGDESSLVVELTSDIDESLLSVVCSDSHGNHLSAPVVNGKATFSNLSPDTAYNLQILVDGFHRLTGETAASYSTPAQTNVVQFDAVTGTEDGSAILSFTVEGPDNGDWKIAYSTAGEEEITVDLLSHMATLTGLTIGKEYSFRLIPGDEMYVTGQTELQFTASELIYAEDVSIISCVNNKLTVTWNSPESSTITEWAVRCYDDADYNQTIITVDNTASFENLDPSKSYTVEVTAAGMSVSQRAYMAANAITISNFQVEAGTNRMSLTWDANQPVPDDGWVLLYNVDGSNIQSSIVCTDNSAEISPIVPDANYNFTIQLTNGDAVLTTPLTYTTAKAKDFSGYGMIRSSMTFNLCKRPQDSDWEYTDLSKSDYTKTFKVGEAISYVGQLHDTYGISDDSIVTVYAFRDENGNVVSYSYTENQWNKMWYKYYGEFDIPSAPDKPGEYTLSIYYNGKLVTNKTVTIEE